MATPPFFVDSFLAYTIGIVVFFAGWGLNQKVGFLQRYNIPEPVTGGILAALASLALKLVFDFEIEYDLATRDILLVYFFTCIGLNARFSDLRSGGRPLLILLGLTLGFIVVQNLVGIAGALVMGMPKAMGVITGSASLIGGHGTAIAWAPEIAEKHGVEGALEIGVAAATLGLVLASLLGGPISQRLLTRFNLSGDPHEKPMVGLPHENEKTEQITHMSLLRVFLALHVSIILGYIVNQGVGGLGLKLPLFVPCLLVAIALSNTIPYLFKDMPWPARTKSLAVTSDFSLSLFITMSLMGMQLWSIAELAGPLFALLGLQVLAAVLFVRFAIFPLMGKNYFAAVLSAGFAGFSLGATPTAIANMTAVTKTHGPAPTAFIILPLVGAFFVDLTNAFVIQFFLGL
jgi:ESS family glutamate:Na+ symporter